MSSGKKIELTGVKGELLERDRWNKGFQVLFSYFQWFK